jgi:hypothetical protein
MLNYLWITEETFSIPALGRQRQVDFWVRGQPGLQSEFQDSQGYTEKPCLEKKKKKKKPKPPPKKKMSVKMFGSLSKKVQFECIMPSLPL